MPLLELWKANQSYVQNLSIEQMVTLAGDGNLRDESECANELRKVFSELASEKLFEHISSCLNHSFSKSGVVLQDLVNELGRRLEYDVENGLYQGRVGKIGYDGIWSDERGHSIVVEVKTTDAYRINLDTIAGYRSQLIETGKISKSSILIIVGRTDTGDVEAQVRGSRHAWDVRLISIQSLIKLVELKQAAEEAETIGKIQSVLIPFEYTKLDNIVDVMFVTAKDVEAASEEAEVKEAIADREEGNAPVQQRHTPSEVLKELRTTIMSAISQRLETNLIARSRATYWSADKKMRVCCTLSKQYESGGYWYGYSVKWHQFLKEVTCR